MEVSGWKRRFRARLLRFLRWHLKELWCVVYRSWVEGAKKEDHFWRSQLERSDHCPRGRARVRSLVRSSTRVWRPSRKAVARRCRQVWRLDLLG
jgi:hypothetical protein